MNLMNCNVTKYYSGDQIKKKEITLACNTEGASSGEVYTVFWWGNHLEELCIDRTVLLNWMFNKSVRSS